MPALKRLAEPLLDLDFTDPLCVPGERTVDKSKFNNIGVYAFK
jgi:hypothetical protein